MEKIDFDKLLTVAQKKYNVSVGPIDQIVSDTKFFSTGNLAIDYVMGGGVPLGRSVEFAGPPSSGKAQRWSDVVHTPDRGYVSIRDLSVGDIISSTTGEDSQVVGIFPQGVKDMVRFHFSDGTSAVCSTEHLWDVVTATRGFGLKTLTVDTSEIMKYMDGKQYRQRDLSLPAHCPVEGISENFIIDPYVLGVLIGDGSIVAGSPTFTTMDDEIRDRVAASLPEGVSIKVAAKKSRATTYRISSEDGKNALTSELRELGLWGMTSKTKFIPSRYLNASLSQRIALMQGLMDTDGYGRGYRGASEKVDNAIYYTSSERLAEDVSYLARSLGTVAFTRSKIPSYIYNDLKKFGAESFRVEMRNTEHIHGFSLFYLERKKSDNRQSTRNRSRQFVRYELLPSEEAVCIKVSADNHLYLTNDFIPTHNTTSALQSAGELQRIIQSGGDEDRGISGEDKILYLDFEQALDPKYAKSLGLDLNDETILFTQPDTLEDGIDFMLSALKTGRVRLAIVDSVAAMTPSAQAEADSVGKALPAIQAKLLKPMGQQLNPILAHYNASVIFINHEMEKLQMGGRPGMPPVTTTPGGNALKFFASVRLSFKQLKKHKTKHVDPITKEETDYVSSIDIAVTAVKNKVAPPFRKAVSQVRFGKGFDNFWTAVTILISHKYIMHNSGYYYFHKLAAEDENLYAPEWMPRATTGQKRPYILSEKTIRSIGESKKTKVWADAIIAKATQVLQEATSEAEAPDEEDVLEDTELEVDTETGEVLD